MHSHYYIIINDTEWVVERCDVIDDIAVFTVRNLLGFIIRRRTIVYNHGIYY